MYKKSEPSQKPDSVPSTFHTQPSSSHYERLNSSINTANYQHLEPCAYSILDNGPKRPKCSRFSPLRTVCCRSHTKLKRSNCESPYIFSGIYRPGLSSVGQAVLTRGGGCSSPAPSTTHLGVFLALSSLFSIQLSIKTSC